MLDLQKASILKRISAWILDLILLATLAVGVAWGLTAVLDYDSYAEEVDSKLQHYADIFGVDKDITGEEYEKLTDDEKELYEEANKAMSADQELRRLYEMMFNLSLITVTFALLISYLVLEFIVPLLFGNGQTVGKKVFGIGIIRSDCVRVTVFALFARTFLGKFTVETMIPVMLLLMSYFGIIGFEGLFVILLIIFVQSVMLVLTKNRTVIHDKFAQTVAVDISSQMVFDTYDKMLEYKKKLHEEKAGKAESWRL